MKLVLIVLGFVITNLQAQENSPYSRGGLGDIAPSASNTHRAMGYTAAGQNEFYQINLTNPAGNSNISGTVFDLGTEFASRTLSDKNLLKKFKSSNALFNYFQLGFTLTPQYDKKNNGREIVKNWTANIGLQPHTKINYKLARFGRKANIDSVYDRYDGTGGSYNAFIGTAYRYKNFSAGINFGYTFGSKNYNTIREIVNDSISYLPVHFGEEATFGGLHTRVGLQYNILLDSNLNKEINTLTLGAYSNIGFAYNATRNKIRETVRFSSTPDDDGAEYRNIDTVFSAIGQKGKITMPTTIGLGATYRQGSRLLLSADYEYENWNNFSYYGEKNLKSTSTFKIGGQFFPYRESAKSRKIKFSETLLYRAGFLFGTEPFVAQNGKQLTQYLVTAGLGVNLVSSRNFRSFRENAVLNLGVEYGKRKANLSNFQENIFRVNVGFTVNANWFFRSKYD